MEEKKTYALVKNDDLLFLGYTFGGLMAYETGSPERAEVLAEMCSKDTHSICCVVEIIKKVFPPGSTGA